ncbi:MAG: glycerol-3-phosphate dehydrogenase/oxidase [Deltaproteobacteria bacterium]|nr:glycerol-3-phosphate dehydrogenase/oxidase [Deltaproteobacteria bacterium]
MVEGYCMEEFSFKTRKMALDRLRGEEFDLLIIGGGITGAAVARDAVTRGLSAALVEKRDFAWGTSSRSSKLIHGGLRYLENFEWGLVFEALSERAHLLKTAPHLVRPLVFLVPIYKGAPRGRLLISVGMWLYDILALFRAPGFHRWISQKKLRTQIPFLKEEGLKGGFRYYDAGMWDDQLVIDTLRDAKRRGAVVLNYAEATEPIWQNDRIAGFYVRNSESPNEADVAVRAKKVIVCAGPWTDAVGGRMSENWRPWLKPSKGAHLVFDLKRIPVPAAMVMNHPADGRIAFVIPRPDFGAGVCIVGTTDGPSPNDPEKADIDPGEAAYLMDLLYRYFPKLGLRHEDIVSAYVGVRPLLGAPPRQGAPLGLAVAASAHSGPVTSLQKISREHHIGYGPGGTVVVAGGKYTTHRLMAKEVVDFILDKWKKEAKKGEGPPLPGHLGLSRTSEPVNPEALEIWKEAQKNSGGKTDDPEGFPHLAAQFRHAIKTGMVLHLEDFYLRRVPLFLARRDHGLPWAETLSHVWAEEMGKGEEERLREMERLKKEIELREAWRKKLG